MRKAINAVVIKEGSILLVRKKETWILPGGKPEAGESDTQCLLREIKEELPQLNIRDLKYFDAFVGTAPHKGDELRAEVYFAKADGEISPSAEINKAEWVEKPEEYNLSDITRKIVAALFQGGYL